MAENKTKPTDASVEEYIASRTNEQQRSDCKELMVLLEKLTRQSPKMLGPSMVGYGSYRYTYESGRTGEAPLAAFAIRGRELVVYLLTDGTCRSRCCPSSASTRSASPVSTSSDWPISTSPCSSNSSPTRSQT